MQQHVVEAVEVMAEATQRLIDQAQQVTILRERVTELEKQRNALLTLNEIMEKRLRAISPSVRQHKPHERSNA